MCVLWMNDSRIHRLAMISIVNNVSDNQWERLTGEVIFFNFHEQNPAFLEKSSHSVRFFSFLIRDAKMSEKRLLCLSARSV